MPGPAIRFQCPFCPKTVVSQQLLKHLLAFHERDTLFYEASAGLPNIRYFNPEEKSGARKYPICLNFPKDQTFYGCFGCHRCYKNQGWDKIHEKCQAAHIAEIDRLWAKYQDPSLASGEVRERIVHIREPLEDKELYQGTFWILIQNMISLQHQLDDKIADEHHPSEYEDLPEKTFQEQVEDLIGPTHYAKLKPLLSYDSLTAAHKKFFPKMNHPETADHLIRSPVQLKPEVKVEAKVEAKVEPPKPQLPPTENVVVYPVIVNTKARPIGPVQYVAKRF